jgi:hypothetical protein
MSCGFTPSDRSSPTRRQGSTIPKPRAVDGREISADLFAVLGRPLAQGRSFRPKDDRPGGAPVAIIGHNLWQRRYGGNAAAIGQRSSSAAGASIAGTPVLS